MLAKQLNRNYHCDYYESDTKITHWEDLVDVVWDLEEGKTHKKRVLRRLEKLDYVDKLPFYPQKSKKWFELRNNCISATAIASILDEDPYKPPIDILMNKCGKWKNFVQNVYVHHGRKYEEIATMLYQFRNNVKVKEYSVLLHPQYPFLGASPDGICVDEQYHWDGQTKLAGRMLEIKCPYTRKLVWEGDLNGEICPHYYWTQMQSQMLCTGLDTCDFLQCTIHEYEDEASYKYDAHPKMPGLSRMTGLERGMVLELRVKDPEKFIDADGKEREPTDEEITWQSEYIYPPRLHMSDEELEYWIQECRDNFATEPKSRDNPEIPISKTHDIYCIRYYYFSVVCCHTVRADKKWQENLIPIAQQFWDYIEHYRNHPKQLQELEQFAKLDTWNSESIFQMVNDHYLSNNPSSTYEPLYQTKNPWRIKNDAKRAFFAKYKK